MGNKEFTEVQVEHYPNDKVRQSDIGFSYNPSNNQITIKRMSTGEELILDPAKGEVLTVYTGIKSFLLDAPDELARNQFNQRVSIK